MSKKKEIKLGSGFKDILESKEAVDAYGIESGTVSEEPEVGVQFEESAEKAVSDTAGQSGVLNHPNRIDGTDSTGDTIAEKEDIQKEMESNDQIENDPVVVDDIELLVAFTQECLDHLETMEEKILTLETNYNGATVDEIFRSMHTMKGTSAFFGFNKIKELSHRLESLLDGLRQGSCEVTSGLVDVLLNGTDCLSKMVNHLSGVASTDAAEGETIEIPDSGIDISPILMSIDALHRANTSQDKPDTEDGIEPASDETAEKEPESAPQFSADALVTDEMRERFVAEASELLDSVENNLIKLEDDPENSELINDTFRYVHTIKGNAGFLGYGDVEKICMSMETVLDSVRTGSKNLGSQLISRLLSVVDSMQSRLPLLGSAGESQADTSAGDAGGKPIGEILVEMGEITQDVLDEALDKQDRKIGEILVSEGIVEEEKVKKALESQGKSAPASAASGGNVFQRKDIRVDMEKLDKLFELTGELITAETMVVQHPELRNLDLNGFESAASYLTKITRQMQEITMTVRMIPLEGLFNKMRRLVRDLSKKFDKTVLMDVSGQETEMDRNVIEQISDPLVHVMRNSIDHGIEDAETRAAAGKPKEGRLQLNAKYEGNEIWITIKDDGKGLDREKILAKAGERGMLKGDEENRSDEDIWKMIFEPGFSTAAQVSDVSGRGVGMDVVRRNIEKLKGKISVSSKTGEGTEIILKIPLTLAIMDGISVKVGNCNYAMALGDILEFHKATQGQVVNTDGKHSVLRLRDELMPVIKLHEFYDIKTEKREITDGILIITNSNNRKAAVLVDDIIGYQQIVVKSLPGYIGSIRAVSGCSIMGDGEVSLIIDMGSLLKEELDEVTAKIQ